MLVHFLAQRDFLVIGADPGKTKVVHLRPSLLQQPDAAFLIRYIRRFLTVAILIVDCLLSAVCTMRSL